MASVINKLTITDGVNPFVLNINSSDVDGEILKKAHVYDDDILSIDAIAFLMYAL